MAGAIPVQRGCGTREEGGIYAEVGVSEKGLPLEFFILDPPRLLDPKLGVTPRGVSLIPEIGPKDEITYHIVDWIGADNYPNVWDYLAEARQFGSSRRLPSSLDFSKLTKKSRLIPVHPHGAILNAERYCGSSNVERFGRHPYNATENNARPAFGGWKCVRDLTIHGPSKDPEQNPAPCCAGIWAQDVTGGVPLTETQREALAVVDIMRHASIHDAMQEAAITAVDGALYRNDDPRLVLREMPSFSYVARCAPADVEPLYHPAFIATFPLTRLVVVQGHGDADSLEKANRAGLSVKLVQE